MPCRGREIWRSDSVCRSEGRLISPFSAGNSGCNWLISILVRLVRSVLISLVALSDIAASLAVVVDR